MMLTARKAPRACQSCRLHLLSLFEYGFASTATNSFSRARYATAIRAHPQRPPRHGSSIRHFTQTRRLANELEPSNSAAGSDGVENVVRQARQTFGETLPKNYLSSEEYILYERLYGPPLRETRPDDLEYLPGEEEEVEEKDVRNVLLRENAHGEYEEVELDPGISFSYEVADNAVEKIFQNWEPNTLEDATAVDEVPNAKDGIATEAILDGEVAVAHEADEIENVEDITGSISSVDESGECFQGEEVAATTSNPFNVEGYNQREIHALNQLQKDMAAAQARPAEEVVEEEKEEIYEEEDIEDEEEESYEDEYDDGPSSDEIRTHPHTMAGRSRTFPETLTIPKETLAAPVAELLERVDIKHILEATEKAFGGGGLPYSTATPSTMKSLPQTPIPLNAAQHRMTDIEADAYITGVMPGTYAMSMATLVEVRKRLGTSWLRKLLMRKGVGPKVMDAGGAGVGVIAWREMAQAEWDVMVEEGLVQGDVPVGKTTVLTGPDTLRHRSSRFLPDTSFIPRLPDYVNSSLAQQHLGGDLHQPRNQYDIIIAPHSLWHLKEDYKRKNVVQNLWSLLDPKGGVLILLEKGLPRGFEAIAGARSLLLERHISSPGDTATENEIQSPDSDYARFADKEEGMIIAPCTNHGKCPMYLTPGISHGRKDFCYFRQRFERPGFLQEVLKAKRHNQGTAQYSYIAVRRGNDQRVYNKRLLQGDAATEQAFEGYEEIDLPDAEKEGKKQDDVRFNSLSLPRIILPPIKPTKHAIIDVCTPSGKLERWTVTKSWSRQAYRDARKSKWGDLWAMGAKTRVPRSLRMGKPMEEGSKGGKLKGVRDGRQGKGGKKIKSPRKFDIVMGAEGFSGIEETGVKSRLVKREKRTKGGRVWKPKKPIGEDDL
ncbi:mitochondrial small ribosomal subunit Rsm22-domain-containing protein [Amylocarpus encephaloides]|uniref:Mitochondrial small ribosomal subunit Rsm22-domain-containing protein n=1 Tax=Amylocarpus encephaloides TaxID=45428 RepID=A0A9P8C058_9HELO|nr:mitochondrial small ribosomal subunit Rsm22-domain-containing protein [Amylocarpus encephaloides]